MAQNYRQKTESIRGRLNPENFAIKKAFSDELSTISYSDVLTYIRFAMKGVELEYTQKSRDAGERVKEHLGIVLKDVTFKYQGSVMTDTHIKGYSDIDLLTICEKFYQPDTANFKAIIEVPETRAKYYQSSIDKLQREVNSTSYTGNALDDLRTLRVDSERILSGIYQSHDLTKPKAIKIVNLNLNREVDIAIANWYDDVTSVIYDKGDYRGIQVYNKEVHSRESADFPFLSIKRINERSSETNGRLKKMIRFLKNVKANSDHEIDLSSFDINAICYGIKVSEYQNLSFYELVPVLYNHMKSICTNHTHADDLISVDGKEYIYRNRPTKLTNLKLLLVEVEAIFIDFKTTVRI
ncbi:MAG: hypothetical protein IPI24_02620 [Ignavibacteria bacterium]|nr:hypothetical protein [Ignavibacteria bacterium]MBK7576309.1 hypothetical protein [Ignavibacteria bacterium]